MNHNFVKSQVNISLCAVCKRDEVSHSDIAECESCGTMAPCEIRGGNVIKAGEKVIMIKGGLLLCAACYDRESNVISEPVSPEPVVGNTPSSIKITPEIHEVIRDNNPTALENEAHNKLGSKSITTSIEYFNARTMAIEELRQKINADDSVSADNKHFELARAVTEHFKHMRSVLFQAIDVQLQCASEQRADQTYLNTLAAKLSKEARESLHLESPNYEPKAPPKTVTRTKTSKFDKAVESFAKSLNIPVEQAKRMMEAGLKSKGIICTCKETPGTCKVHQ